MLNTNNIDISLFGLAELLIALTAIYTELLIALTAIYKVSFLPAPFNFKEIILYIRRNSI